MRHWKIFILLILVFSSQTSWATFEIGWDRPGYDYTSFDMNTPREILCQWSCQQDQRCRAWTFVNPGVQGRRARCWLKYAVPAPVQNRCCTSGVD